MDGQTLLARPFDAASLRITGEPVKVAEGLALSAPPLGAPAFWASGSLLLLAPAVLPVFAKRQLVWMDREGAHRGDVAPEGPYNAIALSPDGSRVALTRWGIPRSAEPNGDIWLWDFARATMTRFTFDPRWTRTRCGHPTDSRSPTRRPRAGTFYQIYRKNASGTGEDERLTNVAAHTDPLAWSPDGRFIVYRQMNRGTGWDLMLLPLEGDRKPVTLLQSPESDSAARFSPDGQVARLPLAPERADPWRSTFRASRGRPASPAIGSRSRTTAVSLPRWRRDGRELFDFTIEGKPMSVSDPARSVTRLERPRELLRPRLHRARALLRSRCGRQTVDHGAEAAHIEPTRLTVVTNWQHRILNASR